MDDEKLTTITTIEGDSQLAVPTSASLDRNPAAVYLASLKPGDGRRAMHQALDTMAGLGSGGQLDALAFPWQQLRYQHTAAIRTQLLERYAPATVKRFLSALRQVLENARRLGLMDSDTCQNACDLDAVHGSTLPAGRAVPAGEVDALLRACAADPGPAGVRDGAVIALLYSTGLRRDELVQLDLEDYDSSAGQLKVRHAKRGKERTAYPPAGAQAALGDWLAIRGQDPGPLFYPVEYKNRVIRRRMTAQLVYNMLTRRAHQAGIQDLSPHDLRRTFVSTLLDAGVDIATVAAMAGHSNVTTTQRYDRRPEATKQKAAGTIHVPYYSRRAGR